MTLDRRPSIPAGHVLAERGAFVQGCLVLPLLAKVGLHAICEVALLLRWRAVLRGF